jgi:polar amino acid transport system substrate-binding protein
MKKVGLTALVLSLSTAFMLSTFGSNQELASAKSTKTLRIVTDATYAPFEYMDKGKIVGFDVDIIKAIGKQAGYTVNVENIGWDPIFVELENKRADAGISSITIDKDRKKTYDFTLPYFLSINEILVPKNSKIKSAKDLKGKVVAVQNATTGQAYAEKILGKKSKNIKKFESNALAIMELVNGGADAVVADNTVVEEYAKNNPTQKLKVISDKSNFQPEFYGVMLPKGSKLKPSLDKAIKAILDNGTYRKIFKDRFGKEPDLKRLKEEQSK